MIGGRVLDSSALVAFASRTSVYAAALVWTAVEEGLVLAVPSTAVTAATAEVVQGDLPVLEVLLGLPVTVIDALTVGRARAVGRAGGDQPTAHVVVCAAERGWPIVTASADRYRGRTDRVEVEQLP